MGVRVYLHLSWIIVIVAVRVVVGENVSAAGVQECRMTRCSHHGPEIRFPFWIKEKQQPEQCGYPGFRVFCDRGNTLLHLQYLANTSLPDTLFYLSKNVSIHSINYTSQEVFVYVLNGSQFTNNLKLFSASSTSLPSTPHFGKAYSYDFANMYYPDITYTMCFSCSAGVKSFIPDMLTSPGRKTFPVYCLDDQYSAFSGEYSISSCTKIFNSSLPAPLLSQGYDPYAPPGVVDALSISWLAPNCSKCEAKGEYCRRKSNASSNIEAADYSTICFPKGSAVRFSIKPITVITAGSAIFVLSIMLLLYYIIKLYKQRKYDEQKIEMFLTDYRAMKPTRYSYADIKKITRNFSDNLGKGGYGSVYKGQITKEIIVAVKVLNSDPKANGEDFINEVGTIGRIYHVNVVRLVGYSADGCNRALIYEFQPNNSLEKFTYSGKMLHDFLGWKKMQDIALGIAKGIEYLHQGCAQQILHFDIKPHNILLDQNFNPKISDFGLAKLCSKDKSIVSMTMARGTIGYIAPEVFSRNFGKVSSKSDVYSFGMLLLEMVGARNNNEVESTSETYFPEWIFHRLEEGGEVTIQIVKEEDSNIARRLTIVGLWCIGWHPVDRPSMKHVINMLESEECPKVPPNPFRSSNVRSFTNDLEVISESE
ncbi:rust resistance kinase Lr10 isoform X1 [Daucus carota subsp. sativus]|uniref:Protein kinase domain-containing protein n=1 Tax=Daucus carota subsp. sativus TaxID=79200 RepID=A0A166EZ25_DAUCS|nr:PREDICTED: rust resistance kinase Lr10-like isoform X1 [Daucus carota subsp. sativus]